MATKKPKQKTEWTKDELAALRAKLVQWRSDRTIYAEDLAGKLKQCGEKHLRDKVWGGASAEFMYSLRDVSAQIVQVNAAINHLDQSATLLELQITFDKATKTYFSLNNYDTGMEAQP